MAKATPRVPTLVQASVTYSAAVKANLGDFENADTAVTESETWNVEGLTPEQTEAWLADRYDVLKERVDERVTEFYVEQSKNCK
jgi:hypothetical protein